MKIIAEFIVNQFRYVIALALRDLASRQKQYLGAGILAEFIMPVVIIGVHYVIFTTLQRKTSNMPTEVFLICGFSCWFVFRNVGSRPLIRFNQDRLNLFFPFLKDYHFIFARILWEISVGLVIIYAGLGFFELFIKSQKFPSLSSIAMPLFVCSLLGVGFNLFLEGISQYFALMKKMKSVILLLIFLSSGIYSSGNQRSEDFIQAITWFNPLSHMLEASRNLIYPLSGVIIDQISFKYSLSWALFFIAMGSIFLNYGRHNRKVNFLGKR